MTVDAFILLYHRITDEDLDPWSLSVSPEHFDEQLRVLARDTTVVGLGELLGRLALKDSDRPLIAITVDDGYADNLYNAAPILQTHALPATFFACTGPISQQAEFWWDTLERIILWPSRLPSSLDVTIAEEMCHFDLGSWHDYSVTAYRAYLTWRAWEPPPTRRHDTYARLWKRLHQIDEEQRASALDQLKAWAGDAALSEPRHRALGAAELTALANQKSVEIGAHSVTHSALASLSLEQQQHEIADSRKWLETVVGPKVTAFSYPFGSKTDYSHESVDLVKGAGFRCGCANVPGLVNVSSDPFQLSRLYVENWSGHQFVQQLKRWHNDFK